MTLELNKTEFNIYGKKANFDRVRFSKETTKALFFETTDSFGSYLHDYNISFWLPKSVINKYGVVDNFGVVNISLPFWFDLSFNKSKI